MQVASLEHPETLILAGTREKRLRLGRELGATSVINVREADSDGILREIS